MIIADKLREKRFLIVLIDTYYKSSPSADVNFLQRGIFPLRSDFFKFPAVNFVNCDLDDLKTKQKVCGQTIVKANSQRPTNFGIVSQNHE